MPDLHTFTLASTVTAILGIALDEIVVAARHLLSTAGDVFVSQY